MMRLSETLESEIIGTQVENFRVLAGGPLILYLLAKSETARLRYGTLWIECSWRLCFEEKVVAGFLDSSSLVLEQLRGLIGHELTSLSVTEVRGDFLLTFSGGFAIETFVHGIEDESWELRRADGYRLGFGAHLQPYERWETE